MQKKSTRICCQYRTVLLEYDSVDNADENNDDCKADDDQKNDYNGIEGNQY